jgi:hypothetical protein
MNPVLAAFFFLLTVGFLRGPAAANAQQVKPAPAKPIPSQGTSAAQDKVIEANIQARLAKSKIGKDGFKVHVQGGVAFWEGNTAIPQHKGAATRMAKAAGASRVVNNIQVSDEGKQKAAANLESGRRRAQVKRGDVRSQP